ncbi:MAG: pyridoxal phosphate-dependent aminotransferase [Alphaproteobacteria bacterium]|nr:pyridoxal phosphate-dependent aminotransferase [Alphaproteobacteria bacterium]
MAFKISQRGRLAPFLALDVLATATALEREGRDIVHLEIGQPSTPAPKAALESARRALDETNIGYTVAAGLPELRQRISDWYRQRYGARVPIERVLITQGSSGAFQLAFLAAFEAGDKVALAAPCYPAYPKILRTLGIEPVFLKARPEDAFQPTPQVMEEAMAEHGALDGLIIANPNNPTGAMVHQDELNALMDWCDTNEVRVIADEIYHGISFAGEETTIVENPHSVVINSFSKYFSMTGWRLGWMVVPEDMVQTVERLQQSLAICAPSISQYAAIGAFDGIQELESNVARYRENRQILLDGLAETGLTQLAPADGAFYIYAGVDDVANDSSAFARDLLEQEGVATTPGIDFDPVNGDKAIRLSFAGKPEDMREALVRIKRFTGR